FLRHPGTLRSLSVQDQRQRSHRDPARVFGDDEDVAGSITQGRLAFPVMGQRSESATALWNSRMARPVPTDGRASSKKHVKQSPILFRMGDCSFKEEYAMRLIVAGCLRPRRLWLHLLCGCEEEPHRRLCAYRLRCEDPLRN